MKTLFGLFFGCMAAVAAAGDSSSTLLDLKFLDTLRNEARDKHPSTAAAMHRVRAAEAAERTVRAWPDPFVGLGVMAAERGMREDEGDLSVMAGQELPRRRLHEARRNRASAETVLKQFESRSSAVAVEADVALAAIELAATDESLVIGSAQLEWIAQIAQASKDRLRGPGGGSAEALRIEAELAQERQEIESLREERSRVAAQLNLLLGRSPTSAWGPLRLPAEVEIPPSLESLMSQLKDRNFAIGVLRQTSVAAEAESEVARREYSPVFSAEMGSRTYSGGELRSGEFLLRMTVPWLHRRTYRAEIERAVATADAAAADAAALEVRLRFELAAAVLDIRNADRSARTSLVEVIPRATAAAEASRNSWISSTVSLVEVLETRRLLQTARLQERRQVALGLMAHERLRALLPPSQSSSLSQP